MSPEYIFDDRKATQVAAMLLKLAGGKMQYLKLLKLMYLIDRKAMETIQSPVTNDLYCSMKCGPVLSNTYDVIKEKSLQIDYWNTYIQRSGKNHISLIHSCPDSELSDEEVEIIEKIYKEFGHWEQWHLVDNYMHKLPEYTKTTGSIPIPRKRILKELGYSEEQQNKIEEELEEWAHLDAYFKLA